MKEDCSQSGQQKWASKILPRVRGDWPGVCSGVYSQDQLKFAVSYQIFIQIADRKQSQCQSWSNIIIQQ